MSAPINNVPTTKMSPDIFKIWYEAFNDMTSTEIIEVEYLDASGANDWKLMFANRNNNAGGKLCTLCDIVLMNTSHIIEHNNGKRHRGNAEVKVQKYRHPSINPAKLTMVINQCATNNPNDEKIKEMVEALRNAITTLNLNDMELIEYKLNNNTEWNKMLSKNDVGYVCNMCKSYTLINLKIIKNHLQTAKHKNNLNFLKGLYHPTISPIKDLLEPPVKIKDEKLTDVVKNQLSVTGLSQKAMDLIEKHAEINIDLLLQIEIQPKINDKWEKLISKPNNTNQCTCTLCKINIVGVVELRKHLRHESHIKLMKILNGLHHPIIAPFTVPTEQITENTESVEKANIPSITENSKPTKTESVEKANVPSITENSKPTKTESVEKANVPSITENSKPTKTESVEKADVPSITENSKPIKTETNTNKETMETNTKNVNPSVISVKTIPATTKNNTDSTVDSSIKETVKNTVDSAIKETVKNTADASIKETEKKTSNPASTKSSAVGISIKSDSDFRAIIPSLKPVDVTAIEYYKDNMWRKMIKLVDRSYNCCLCSVSKISNFKCLLDHLKGKKHFYNMTTVTRLYHPTKTIPKNVKSLPAQNVESITNIPAIETTSAKPKEQRLPKTAKNDTAGNLININANIKVVNTDIITVEDSPEREIINDKQELTNSVELKKKENIDITKKSIDNELSTTKVNSSSNSKNELLTTKLNSSSNSNKESISKLNSSSAGTNDKNQIKCNNNEKAKALINDKQQSSKDNEPNKIVLNPAAIIAKKQHKAIDDMNITPQYQQNIIISPRYKSGQNSTTKSTSKSTDKTKTTTTETDKTTPNFSTKSFAVGIDNNIEGLIGVEYVVKIIQHAADDTPRYECCLCEIELGGVAMQNHLRNLKHRLKYLDRHFQTCVKQYIEHRTDGIIMTEIVDRIAKAIEKYHGRDLPYECVHSDYRKNRQDIMSKVFSFRHASDLSGPSFTNIVNKSAVEEIIRNKHKWGEKVSETDKRKTTFDKQNNDNSKRQRIHSPKNSSNKNTQILSTRNTAPEQNYPYINTRQQNILPPQQQIHQEFQNSVSQAYPILYNPMNPSLDDEEHRRLSENFIKNTKIRETRSPPPKKRLSSRRHRSRTPPSRRYERSRSPIRRHDRNRKRTPSRSPLREGDIWQAYRRKFDIDVTIIDLDYEGYNKDPQSYPLYNEEWQNFWAKRMNTLKAERKDHQSYDFTSEWATYFPRRLKELYENDVEDLKVRLRERFVLPMHNRELKDKRYFLNGNYDDNEIDIEAAPMPPVISSAYQQYLERGTRSRTRTRSPSKTRPTAGSTSRSSDNINFNMARQAPREETLSSDDDNTVQARYKKKKNNIDDQDRIDFGPLTVVNVLRILTALEDNLGSLGPRVVDLLSKALTLEKVKPNYSDEILLTAENCVFLETCKEKLKGQVLAGVITATKLRAVRQAIKDISAMVNKANEERAKKPLVKPPVERKVVQPVQKLVIPAATIPKISKIQTPINPIPPRINTDSQIVANREAIQQSQHPTIMSQAEKKDLACKLAAALTAQGKTDISTANCEKLIEVYAMIDKKKSEIDNRSGNNDNRTLSGTLTDILSSGNSTALLKLFQSNKQQQNTAIASTSSRDNGNNSRNQLAQNNQQQAYNQNQRYQNNNFNSIATTQNHNNNNFNQLANFDTSLNIRSAFNTQQLSNVPNQMNLNDVRAVVQRPQIWQNITQGNNQNWIAGNTPQQLHLNANSNLNKYPSLSQTLLTAAQTSVNNINQSMPRIDTGAQNTPAYATGASYKGNPNNNNNNNSNNNNNNTNNNNNSFSYRNIWHRQNQLQQQLSTSLNMRGNLGGNIDNSTNRYQNQQSQNQSQNLLGNPMGTDISRILPNSNQNSLNTIPNRRR